MVKPRSKTEGKICLNTANSSQVEKDVGQQRFFSTVFLGNQNGTWRINWLPVFFFVFFVFFI